MRADAQHAEAVGGVDASGGEAVEQAGYAILTNVLSRATDAGEPASSVQSSAMLIFMLPHSLAALSLITALYPRMSAAIRDGDSRAVRSDYGRGIVLPAAFTIPAMVGWSIVAVPAVTVLFDVSQRQQEATALAAAIMLLGVVPFGVDVLNQRVFYALEDGRTAFRVQLVLTGVATLVNLGALLAAPSLTVPIAAAGLVVSNLTSSSVGAWLVRHRLGLLGGRAIFRTLARILTASLLAGLIAWPATLGAARWLPDTRPGNLLVAGVGGLFFSAAYLLLVYVLQIRPVLDILAPFARRLPVLRSL